MKPYMRFAQVLLAVIVTGGTLGAFAQNVVVIANTSVKADSISREELRSVFLLRTRTLKDGSWVEPVLEKGGPTDSTFVKQFLDRDNAEIHTYYQGLVFTGKASMPKELSSDAEVVDYVRRKRGAIGYISSATHADGVKVLSVSEMTGNERRLVRRVEPEYPDTLRHMGIGGNVRLELTIAAKGAVETVAILGGNPILADAAVKAVRQWIYEPGTRSKTEVNIPFDPK